MTITPAQIRGARAMLRLTQGELAAKAGISQRSLAMIETEATQPREGTLDRLRKQLEELGAVFFESEAGKGVLRRTLDDG